MGGKGKVVFTLVLAALLALGVVACGGGDNSTSSNTSSAPAKNEPPNATEGDGSGTAETKSSGPNKNGNSGSHDSSAGSNGSRAGFSKASKEFVTPHGDNSIQGYGQETSTGDRETASAVLEAYMAARADGDWAKACAQLVPAAVVGLERAVAPGSGCAGTLAALHKRLAPSAWANTMTGTIAALRREGEHAFALYHGTGGTDYFMQMSIEGGDWKVAAVEPTAFP